MLGQPITVISEPVAELGQFERLAHCVCRRAAFADRRLVENAETQRQGSQRPFLPIARNLSWRRSRSVSPSSLESSAIASPTTRPTTSIVSSGARWAPPHQLGDHLVDHFELLEVGRSHLHHLGGIQRVGVVAPQDRGAAFRRDHRVGRILQHVDAVRTRRWRARRPNRPRRSPR